MNTQTQETLKTIQEHIDLQMYGHAWDKCQELIEALEQPTMTYEQGFAHGYEAHRVEQKLEHPQSDEYTENYQQGYDDGWEAKKAEQPAQEPVAEVIEDKLADWSKPHVAVKWNKVDFEIGTKFYTHPAPSCSCKNKK
jgi:hypothetical protein